MSIMTELAIPATASGTLTDKVDYAKALAPADLLPPAFRGKPANVLLAMEAGVSLGKTAIEIMQNAHVINGKLGFSAEFQRALVLQSGHKIRVFMDGEIAVAQGVRADDKDFTYEIRWNEERAKKAGLTSDNWKKHTHSMLKARATTELCRDAFADVIRGYRSVEELEEIEFKPSPASGARPGDRLAAAAGLIIDEEPAPIDVSDAVVLITEPQMKKMQALFHEKGFTDRTDRLDYVRDIVQIDVASSKELSRDQASTVIDALDKVTTP